jgi:signal transduction histidine kinase
LLHPPLLDEAGFVSAVRWYVDGFAQRSGIKVNLDLPLNLGRLPQRIEMALFERDRRSEPVPGWHSCDLTSANLEGIT